jgi:hypothetical protein
MTVAPTRPGRSSPLVHLWTVPSAFQARVVAARLGADGIVTELRGAIGGPYPFGEVSIWVYGADERIARELLLADEVEDVFATVPPDEAAELEPWPTHRLAWNIRQTLALLALVMVVVLSVAAAGRLFF